MRWSFPIARVAGIQIRVHVGFLVFLAWVGLTDGVSGGLGEAVAGVSLVCLVFGCILLHEFGHAFAARRYGIRTPDITLLPIGGMARLERLPERPSEEIVVALAGPAVSALLAVIFGAVSGYRFSSLESPVPGWEGVSSKLFTINTGLLFFNLLPVFPMDGGRVLRALLAMQFSYVRSTRMAAGVGQVLAVILGAFGLFASAPMLVLLAVFVFFGAGSEAAQVQVRETVRDLRVEDAMLTTFARLPPDAQLADAVDLLMHSPQHSFPLIDGLGRYFGLITRPQLMAGLREAGPLGAAMAYARKDLPALGPDQLFSAAAGLLRELETPALPVVDASGRLIGLLSEENFGEILQEGGKLRARLFSGLRRVWR